MINLDPSDHPKMRKSDRIVVLKPVEGEKALNGIGLVDTRLFKGGNNLHVKMDDSTCLWSINFEKGNLPTELKQQFTSFAKAKEAIANYYSKRNVEIAEIID